MDAQMAYLANKGYRSITPQEFYDQLATGQNPKQKLVMITFDDGGADNYTYAFPILKKYGMIGVFYVPSSRHGMTNAQLKEMSDAGMVIDPHGKTHMMLAKVTDSAVLASEIGDSKIALEHLTGKKVVSFCYPGCEYNGTVISTLKSDGYKLAFSCGKSIDHKISGSYVLSRMHVYNDMNNFKSILSGVWYYPAPYAD
jgi:peptidoglycan/xylan/chitin deacetylase (PgdA/CDA1 family)